MAKTATPQPPFLISLSERAKQGLIPTLIGRKKELTLLKRIVSEPKPIHPLLLGPPGVGKTQLVQALAMDLSNEDSEFEVLELDLNSFSAETKYMGQQEEKLRDLLAFASEKRNRIIFIDEFHALMGIGQHIGKSGGIEQNLKPALTSGTIRVIAATTKNEFDRFVAVDSALSRRFQPIDLISMDDHTTLELLGNKNSMARMTGQQSFSETTLALIVANSLKKDPQIANPARSLRLLQELQMSFDKRSGAGFKLREDPLKALSKVQKVLHEAKSVAEVAKTISNIFESAPNTDVSDSEAASVLSTIIQGGE